MWFPQFIQPLNPGTESYQEELGEKNKKQKTLFRILQYLSLGYLSEISVNSSGKVTN